MVPGYEPGRAEHFTVDGTLIEAWASLKSLRKDEKPSEPPDDPGNPSVNFHGERRTNATHQSTTDPEARLASKGPGKEARLCYSENVLMENRNVIMIDLQVDQANGSGRRAAMAMDDGKSFPAADGSRLPATAATTLRLRRELPRA